MLMAAAFWSRSNHPLQKRGEYGPGSLACRAARARDGRPALSISTGYALRLDDRRTGYAAGPTPLDAPALSALGHRNAPLMLARRHYAAGRSALLTRP